MTRQPRPIGPRGARAWCAIGLVVLLPAVRLPEVTQTDAGDASLRELPGVAVVAEQVSSDVRHYGLDEAWIEKRVTSALGRDSIPLMTRSAALTNDHQPLLVARLQSVRLPGRETFAWHLSLVVHQKVIAPGRSAAAMLATTWEATASIGITSGSMLKSSVGKTLDDQSAQFVEAWRMRAREE